MAVAVVNNAESLVSHDPHMPKLAGARLKVIETRRHAGLDTPV